MPVSVRDFEVFILTCNRAQLLQKAIKSLLRQTVSGFSVTVLDNASLDDTAAVVAAFQTPTLRIISAEKNLGGLGNLQRGQQFASRKYMMLFHDDDQLHPGYVESALRLLGEHPDAALVVSNAMNIKAGTIPVTPRELDPTTLKLDRVHFATLCYLKNKLAFSSAIYRTDFFKSLILDGLMGEYGKWGDRPIMIEAVRDRAAIVFNGAFVYSGRHAGQDQHSKATQPPHTLWLNRERYFRGILGDVTSTFPGLCFCVMNHRRLKSGYKRRIVEGVSFSAYLQDAFNLGATSRQAWRFRFLAPKPVQGLFNLWAHSRLRRRNRLPA